MKKIKDIEWIVCNFFSLEPGILHSKSRKRELVKPRQIVMYFSLNEGHHENVIAAYYNRDRTTVYHARDTVTDLAETNKIYRDQFFSLKNMIDGIKEEEEETVSSIIDREVEDILSLLPVNNFPSENS